MHLRTKLGSLLASPPQIRSSSFWWGMHIFDKIDTKSHMKWREASMGGKTDNQQDQSALLEAKNGQCNKQILMEGTILYLAHVLSEYGFFGSTFRVCRILSQGFERWDKLLSAMKLATHWYAWRRGMCFILERESWTVCEYLCQVVRLAWVCTIHVDSETVFSIPYSCMYILCSGGGQKCSSGRGQILTVNHQLMYNGLQD